jgi:hypothetical protein
MTVALNLLLGGLAGLCLLPLLAYMAYLLLTEWRHVSSGINATRIMMVGWSLVFEWLVAWRLYATWYRVVYDDLPPWVDEGGAVTSFLLLVAAALSLVAFVLRQRTAARSSFRDR